MANPLKDIGGIPVNEDNEALIITNAIKNKKNREIFVRHIDYRLFRRKEFQTMAFAIQAIETSNMEMNTDAIILKSKTCPIKKIVDFEFIETLKENFPEVPESNFIEHLVTLRTDSVKAQAFDLVHKSLIRSFMNPQAGIKDLEVRVQALQDLITSGYSSTECQFLTMKEAVAEYVYDKEHGVRSRTTGFRQLDEKLIQGLKEEWISIIAGLANMGKTHTLNTPIIMYDGSIKMIQDIEVGDLLMGVDSLPRKVTRTWTGVDDIYTINQCKGDAYEVTGQHLLSLKRSYNQYYKPDKKLPINERRITHPKGEVLNISVLDYLKKGNGWKTMWKGYKSEGWEMPERKVELSPYFLGIWLSDGNNDSQLITNPDIEVRKFLKDYASSFNMYYTERQKKDSDCYTCVIKKRGENKNIIKDYLEDYNLFKNKHIPDDFKYTSRKKRMELLSGLLDGDGYLTYVTYEISTKYEQLKDDILYLARSLGFYSVAKYEKKKIKSIGFEGKYWRIRIVGDTYLIPCKVKRKKAKKIKRRKNFLFTGFNVKYKGKDKFYSISLEDTTDQLYLLGDGTVTHNSSFALSMMNNLSNKGVPSANFALEMPNQSIITKLLAFNTNLTIRKVAIEWDNLDVIEKKVYEHELERLARNQYIYLNDKPSQGLSDIKEQTMLLQDKIATVDKSFDGYIVILIDLFGKIKEFLGSDNFARDYEQRCNEVQAMTRELGVHMCLVAQIVRSVMQRKFKRPSLADIKNAGALGEIADLIFGIHRPNYDPEVALKSQLAYGQGNEEIEPNPDENLAEILILKGRMAQANQLVNFYFDPNTTRFSPIEEDYQNELNATKFDDDDWDNQF